METALKNPRSVTTLGDLTPDPKNARRHTPRNVGMIESAMREVGAARSIVIDENGVVLAGNATVEGAAAAGIERVRVVDADGNEIIAVRRSGLTAKQKTRLALLDNRTAELAEWETTVLSALADDGTLDGLWSADELSTLLASNEPIVDEVADSSPLLDGVEYRVVVDCRDEQHQAELLERLEQEGLKCRALMS